MNNTSFLKAEADVFAAYSLKPTVHQTRLQTPRMELRVTEVGDGEPTLFLHGFSLCSAHWAPLMARLPSLHSIAIDMPGHGGSDGIDFRGVNLRRWFRDMLSNCLDELGLDSVHVVGHSQGAFIGLGLALDAPERVRSLVMIGTPAVALGARVDSLRMLARPGIGPLLLSMPKPASAYRDILVRTIGLHAVESASAELIRATYLGTQRRVFGTTISTYLREMFKGVDAKPQRYVLTDEELARIERPVLIVWGREDTGYQTTAEVRERAALIPNSRFELVPGGHEPWLDELESTATQVSSFLEENRTPRAAVPEGFDMSRA
jgi:pimeloyl-[acyl-carrier protein] methyl ester esterase